MSRNDKRNGVFQTHYFSTHFYSMLCEQGPQGVQRWTAKRGIDIFKKRLIFVPVNKALHWSLTVIGNPGAIESHLDVVGDDNLGKRGLVERASDLAKPCPRFLFFDSLQCHSRKAVSNKLRGWLNAEWSRRAEGKADDVKDPFTAKSMEIFGPKGM